MIFENIQNIDQLLKLATAYALQSYEFADDTLRVLDDVINRAKAIVQVNPIISQTPVKDPAEIATILSNTLINLKQELLNSQQGDELSQNAVSLIEQFENDISSIYAELSRLPKESISELLNYMGNVNLSFHDWFLPYLMERNPTSKYVEVNKSNVKKLDIDTGLRKFLNDNLKLIPDNVKKEITVNNTTPPVLKYKGWLIKILGDLDSYYFEASLHDEDHTKSDNLSAIINMIDKSSYEKINTQFSEEDKEKIKNILEPEMIKFLTDLKNKNVNLISSYRDIIGDLGKHLNGYVAQLLKEHNIQSRPEKTESIINNYINSNYGRIAKNIMGS